jgi:hypothetical protein
MCDGSVLNAVLPFNADAIPLRSGFYNKEGERYILVNSFKQQQITNLE